MIVPLRLLLSLVCLSGMSRAAVVNIDFTAGLVPTTPTGLAAAPDAAGSPAVWNEVTRYKSTREARSGFLVDWAGDSTPVTISLGIDRSDSNGDQERGGASQYYTGLMSDYLFTDSGDSAVATHIHDLYFYRPGDKFTGNVHRGQNALFPVDGVLEEGIEFVKFSVRADAGGKIAFSWSNGVAGPSGTVDFDEDGTSGRYSAFNALQVVHNESDVVPEPSGVVMALIGGLAALFRRRRS